MFRRHHGIAITAGLMVAGSMLAAAAGLSTARLLTTTDAIGSNTGGTAASIVAMPVRSALPARRDVGHGTGHRNETVIAKTSTEIWPPLLQARPVMAPRNSKTSGPSDAAPGRRDLFRCAWGRCQDI